MSTIAPKADAEGEQCPTIHPLFVRVWNRSTIGSVGSVGDGLASGPVTVLSSSVQDA